MLAILWFLCYFSNAADIIIDTQLGKIKGTQLELEGLSTFYGIQYADSPIGSLRFRPAQLNTSAWNGIYDATHFGHVCMQLNALTPFVGNQSMDEDCLYLNIWTPNPNKTANLPVMFYIFGGGFMVGAGSEASYNGMRIVSEAKDFVYISINYRLGIFGFLQNEEIYNEDESWKSYGGQNGINDQIVALKWVKQYISDYGGNPDSITIFGESAGGLSVCNLLISPLAKGLFDRAIIESGACTAGWGADNTSFGLSGWNSLLQSVGYPNNLTYLRGIDGEELNNKMKIRGGELWQGSVDQLVLTDLPANIYANLQSMNNVFNANKVIIGVNTMDGVDGFPWHLGPRPTTDAEYQKLISEYVPNSKQDNELYNHYYPPSDFTPYPPDHNSYELAWFTITGDVCLACPSLLIADQISNQLDKSIVYFYQFGGPGKNGSYYAPHASELPFVFNIPEEDHFFDMPWDQQLSNEMVSAWTNFGKYGVPNITTTKANLEWTVYGGKKSEVMIFRDTIKMEGSFESNYRRNVCNYWFTEIGIDVMKNICNARPAVS